MRPFLTFAFSAVGVALVAACTPPSNPPAAQPMGNTTSTVPNLGNLTGVAKVTTPSGIVFESVKNGSGTSPKATDTVKVNYRGTLITGTEFDSSYKRGEPAEFPVTAVIKGWTEALQLMNVGSKWQLFIPSDLAYGAEGRPPVIGPNAALVFEVELLGVQ